MKLVKILLTICIVLLCIAAVLAPLGESKNNNKIFYTGIAILFAAVFTLFAAVITVIWDV